MAAVPLFGQETTARVFAPFVSGFGGEQRNNLVRLSWLDSPDVRGPVYIFRSALPFDGSSFLPPAPPVEIPYGAGSFVDEIETGETIYYFAAASDERGRRYDILLPSINMVKIGSDTPPSVPAAEARPVLSRESGIRGIRALGRGDRVTINFTGEDAESAALTLYRSIRPLRETQDLLGAVIVQTGVSSPYTDTPVPGIPYYYAVISGEDLVRGTVEIVPGRNATTEPALAYAAGAAGAASRGANMRPMPLPRVFAQENGNVQAELSAEAGEALADIPSRPRINPSLKKPRVFARDMETYPSGGEEYSLSLIVKGSFSGRNWESAREELTRFLALPRSAEIGARARFYLGQCWYYLGRAREGLFEFLSVQDKYPAESAEWIEASLDLMKETPSP